MQLRRSVYIITIGSAVLAILSFVLYRTQDIYAALTFSIIFGTIAYHFIMRLAVGALFDTFMKNRADLSALLFVSRKPLVRRVVQKSLSDKEDIKNSFCYSKSAVCQLHKNSKRRTFR